MDDATWLAERRKGVGASEAAALCNCSPWQTPLGLYLLKTGEIIDEPSTRMRFGLYFEQAIKQAYEEETGATLEKPPRLLRHPEWPWMLASLDYWTDDKVVDAKKSSERAAVHYGPSGSSEIPRNYYLQLQQQMAVSGRCRGELAVLIGDDDFRILHCERDDRVIEQLAEIEREFMVAVENREPPLPDFQHSTIADLLSCLEPEVGSVIDLGDDAIYLAMQYELLGKLAKDISDSRTEVKARLLHAMGSAEIAYLPRGLGRLKRTEIEGTTYTVNRAAYYRFTCTVNKEAIEHEYGDNQHEEVGRITGPSEAAGQHSTSFERSQVSPGE